jgi:hypothetical protein
MTDRDEILELVSAWAQRRDSGQPAAVEELCRSPAAGTSARSGI